MKIHIKFYLDIEIIFKLRLFKGSSFFKTELKCVLPPSMIINPGNLLGLEDKNLLYINSFIDPISFPELDLLIL